MFNWPKIEYKEEAMREGMQIESKDIPVDDKVRLLDALSETGLKHIAVGSFVSPRYTPQMARIEEIVQRFTPRPDVKYTALLGNEKAVERASEYVPPLTIESSRPILSHHLCDVFTRRNFNRSQAQELESWPKTVALAFFALMAASTWGLQFLEVETVFADRLDPAKRIRQDKS